MNKIQKTIVSILVMAIMTLSASAALAHATYTSATLPWNSNELVNPGQLTVAGSSTVGPIAQEEITQGGFVSYWNSLVNAGLPSSTISQVNLATLGSGTAFPALEGSGGTSADVGEMSRPMTSGEYSNTITTNTAGVNTQQQYAVGVDSVAIVLSPDMTWFPAYLQTQGVTGLTTLQVAELFVDNTPTNTASQGLTGVTGSTPLYSTWAAFFTAQGWTIPSAYTTDAAGTIQRAVRDPTSGTFDCFDNYFIAPNGYQFENKAVTSSSFGQSTVVGSEEMAPFTYCEQNQDVYNTVSKGTNYIGFISLGYLISQGGPQGSAGLGPYTAATTMVGLNIAYNMAATPSGSSGSPLITYFGTAITSSNPLGFPTGTVNPPSWGSFVQPTTPNVIWAYSGIQGSAATGQYEAWRWLWEVTPGFIPASGPTLVAGVWIAYMMAEGTTNAGEVATWNNGGVGTGTSNFVADNNYIPLERDDMAGGQVLSSTLAAYTPLGDETSTFPTGQVNFNDITYFVGAYINYQVNGIYNPYADFYATGKINFNDILAFVGYYIEYYTTWNPGSG